MSSKVELLKEIGEEGFYQKRTVFIIILCSVVNGPMLMATVFFSYAPDFKCKENYDFNSTSSRNLASNYSEYNTNRYSTPSVNEINECMVNNATSQSYCTEFIFEEGVVTASTEFKWVCEDSWKKPLVASCIMLGFMIGSICGGFISDRYGRRRAFIIAYCCLALSTILTAVTPFWYGVHVCMVLYGMSAIIRATTGTVLINEFSSNKTRVRRVVYTHVGSCIGYSLLPVCAYLLPYWRNMMLALGISQMIVVVPVILYLKESLGWLEINGKTKEFNELLQEIRKLNKLDSDKVQKSTEADNPENEKLNNDNKTEPIKDPQRSRKFSYVDLVKISFLRRRMFILGISWFAVNMAFFGLSLNTNNLGGSRYLNCLFSALVEFPGSILAIYVVKKLGARMSYIACTLSSGLCLLLTPCFQLVNVWAGVASSMIGKLFITSSFSVLYVFTGDLFPTLLRTQSYGACSFIARWAGLIVPYVIFIGEEFYQAIPYFIMGSIAVFACIAMSFLPETKKNPLPDTLEDAKKQEQFRKHISSMCRKPLVIDENENKV